MDTPVNSSENVVVDASVILSKLLPDERHTALVESYFIRFSNHQLNFFAPLILKYEVANSLRSAIIQLRLDKKLAQQLLNRFLKLPIMYSDPDFIKTLDIAIKNKLTFYDASYVQLAQSLNIPLISLDKALQKIK